MNKKGLSLTELLIASVLIGIVMVGVMAFNFSVKSIEDTSTKASLTALRASQALGFLKRDAETATGDASDPGIVHGINAGGDPSICFRQDKSIPVTPGIYTDDTWVCFYVETDQLKRCANLPAAAAVPLYTDATCTTATGKTIPPLIDLTDKNFFTVAKTIDGALTRISSVTFTITTRYDTSTGASVLENPTYTLTTKVSPIAHSR